MCGIAGIITANGTKPDERVLDALSKALVHRGGDGVGRYVSNGVGFIQTRLAIIDVEGGKQPFFDGENVLVANGEIYNYLELKKELADVSFSTHSDCEIPLHLYRKQGLEFIEKLRGMYAIAIHDHESSRVILSRDSFGIKPLYYAETSKGLVFASEAQAIIATGLVSAELNKSSAFELLQLQFTTGRQTIYKGIKRVLLGETLIIENGKITETRLRKALPETGVVKIGEEEALDRLNDILENSVELHQRSDVPFGMFLSGGVDSSVILALMERLNSNPVMAFTAGFSGTKVHDEREHAKKIAKAVNAEHIELDITEKDFWKHLPEIAGAMEDPVADYAILPTYLLAKLAKPYVKVILSGEGGDELFAGYGRYRSAIRTRFFAKKMRRKGAFHGLGILRDESSGWRDGFAEIENIKRPNLTKLQAVQAIDSTDWLSNDLLIKLDRCLMANGMEGRVPFLDMEVANFAFNLPDNLKIKGKTGKWLMRKWLEKHFPVSKPFAPKKGFTVPVAEWIAERGSELGHLVAIQPCIIELCKPEETAALFSSSGKKAGFAAWSLLFYALWHRKHILRLKSEGDVFDVLSERL